MGTDSIARNNMLRYMKKTWTYLVNKLNAIDLLGYNKVADNTFPNIVSMTAGKFLNELSWNESLKTATMDNFNFIWNNYSSKGDHGMRFGRFRETYVVKLEERLPFMLIVFPSWFITKYPEVYRNLRINARRLTTPFDIFATLEHILDFNGIEKKQVTKQRSMSLLHEIPENRTCDEAGDNYPNWSCFCI
ncbi:Hypothetical predicted protein [Mytilus galloprovincialis]|uniref:Uncharacterized protein n=1 Tax=Mytilus galloprovincialis TaxID=29158 RepID=A0A8B6DWY6_MYTGA|nr:Hypothetical predicted protein [Mytilus galloprovincialis]